MNSAPPSVAGGGKSDCLGVCSSRVMDGGMFALLTGRSGANPAGMYSPDSQLTPT